MSQLFLMNEQIVLFRGFFKRLLKNNLDVCLSHKAISNDFRGLQEYSAQLYNTQYIENSV